MIYIFGDCQIYYRVYGKSKSRVNIFLHGWGQSGKCFSNILKHFKGCQNITIDFPPFGASGQPHGWNLYSYANMVMSLCDHLKIERCNLIGHSFGGRIAILIASLKPSLVDKMVLVGSAGMKPKHKISYYFNVFSYKILKFFGYFPKNAGSSDYCKLSDDMKKTFVSIVNTPLEEYCPQIVARTLIVFGERDNETPVYMAKRLNRLIKNSELVILEGAGHFVFVDREMAFVRVTKNFLLGAE